MEVKIDTNVVERLTGQSPFLAIDRQRRRRRRPGDHRLADRGGRSSTEYRKVGMPHCCHHAPVSVACLVAAHGSGPRSRSPLACVRRLPRGRHSAARTSVAPEVRECQGTSRIGKRLFCASLSFPHSIIFCDYRFAVAAYHDGDTPAW